MTPAELHVFMAAQHYGVVSSIGPGGAPQSALVGIAVTPACEIVFDTVKSSRKYPDLIARPACSVVLGWSGEQTVQFEGLAAEPQGDELRRAQEAYFSAWPDGRDRVSGPASPGSSSAPPGSASATSMSAHPSSPNSPSATAR